MRTFARTTVALCALIAISTTGHPAHAADTPLVGHVSSAEERAMEGVVVSARRDGSTMTTSVVTDRDGRYQFPAAKLAPGRYSIDVRAGGHRLPDAKTVTVAAGKTATVDLKLTRTDDVASQLSNAEWMASMPDTPERRQLINCTGCHTLERIAKSTYSGDDFMQLIPRMNQYAPMSMPTRPQLPLGERQRTSAATGDGVRRLADYLASINLNARETWAYPLKPAPRVTGRGTRVVITEYAMPNELAEPHDVIVDADGIVWWSNFGEQVLGRLDPKTGTVTEFAIPVRKDAAPKGSLDLELDDRGNLWIANMFQAQIGRFDPRTEKFTFFTLPKEKENDRTQLTMVEPHHSSVDDKVWFSDVGTRHIFRLDLKSGQIEDIDPFTVFPKGSSHSTYGLRTDAQNNLFYLDYAGESIGRIDARTLAITIHQTPTKGSRPRRGSIDDKGRIAFGEFVGGKVGLFDTTTLEMKEWPGPDNFAPYDAVIDRNDELWSGGMNGDRVLRVDSRTGASTVYPLPRSTNVRRVFVDDRTKPVTVWIGNNHSGSILKIEPLD
ncbi:MAG TPA: carboxypeptidase regulatory-like domain-containing protein [Alphaproteobacteria bacterium]|nr:carboxypeptidase regulatory-like domain-containing protein [Alphaproteobacteria bacterium]